MTRNILSPGYIGINLSCHDHDRMVIGFTTKHAISVYRHSSCDFESRSGRGVLDTNVCDKISQ
jgi:hypothetical protein